MACTAKAFVFVSHQHEDRDVATWLRAHLEEDFLGMAPVFVSSDEEGIRAGEPWFDVIRQRVNECEVLLILCTGESVIQPWVNFEFGAAWALRKVVIPVCHSGYLPAQLGMPFSQSQGVELSTRDGVKALYQAIAGVLGSHVPAVDFEALAGTVPTIERVVPAEGVELDRRGDANSIARIRASLENRERWRTVRRVAVEAGLSEDEALRILRADQEVVFGYGSEGRLLVRLRSRDA
jgi:hypothetical protein